MISKLQGTRKFENKIEFKEVIAITIKRNKFKRTTHIERKSCVTVHIHWQKLSYAMQYFP